ncbi:hypothetical protein [Candidatus Hodgkinia cicadicola]|uniref:hypothetical protein n=1 Tax=Candidatus Hodgkinia cicadicola TaxID=573658 RepID=UPI0011BA87E9
MVPNTKQLPWWSKNRSVNKILNSYRYYYWNGILIQSECFVIDKVNSFRLDKNEVGRRKRVVSKE